MVLPVATTAELERALDAFEQERRRLDVALLENGRVPHQLRHRVGEVADDVAAGVCHVVLPAAAEPIAEYGRVDRAIQDDFAPNLIGRVDARPRLQQARGDYFVRDGVHARMRLGFKALFFSVRALQDALNVCCFVLLEGKHPSPPGSIQYALGHPESPVGRAASSQARSARPVRIRQSCPLQGSRNRRSRRRRATFLRE
jgi:hypothetical protein